MCLTIPGEIIDERGEHPARSARVRFGETVKEVKLTYVPEAVVGDLVLVHAEYAISVVDSAERARTLQYFDELRALLEQNEPA
jgi:hydrogenase assembly chaperone HypC/HupF